ncbi:MAG: AAA family ATPase [Deltaproteobacteria bacterium]|nr:AAA family ATPase [Deltaproteobacteria bacterium]MBW2394989.1 AAA family ATPase [Deltaproteobacteria bacterium]
MDIAEKVDPEQWHRILDGFFQILSEGVHRFEGTVNQYTGDGIMALFGAPLAHEDHAQRACFAALRVREAIDGYADELRRQGHNFAVRIGLNSGEVVVGTIGDDLRMDYTAQGHTVGVAARIEGLAAPGRVYLSGETARLVDGYFELRDLGATQVKGVEAPLELFELEGVGALRTRLERSRARGFTRFVGRGDELKMLEQGLERADAGERQIVGVVGEAGIGKSRLCAEFVERARARGVPIYETHCPSHGKSLSGVGARELNQSFFGLSEHDAPGDARRKIAGTLVLLDPGFQEVLPLVFDSCGVPDPERPAPPLDPALRRHRTVAFLRALIQARSARECALFLLDDLHWADPETDLFFSQIVETAAGTRTMVLCNFRPEYEAGWMESSDYLRIPLRALTAADSARLVDTLLGSDRSLEGLRTRILERAGGNPFFAEELAQSMVESGVLEGDAGAYRLRVGANVDEIQVPDTVQAVLAARIDRLGQPELELLQAAAVVGREFSETVLAKVVGREPGEIAESLAALRAADFVVEEAVYPEIEYAFKHPLTHEVAYRSQLASQRAGLHDAAAAALAERGVDPALIGQHLEQAGESLAAAKRFAEAAGEDVHKNPEPAYRSWRKVRELCVSLAEPEARALHEQAISQILLAAWGVEIEVQEAAELHEEGMALAEARGDVRAQVILLGIYSFLCWRFEDPYAQVEVLERAASLVADSDDFELYAMVQQRLGWAHMTAGNLARCLDVTEAGLARCSPDRSKAGRLAGFGSQLFMLAQRAYAKGLQGHFQEAEQGLLEAQRFGVEDDDSMTLASIMAYQSNLATLCGQYDKAEAAARQGIQYVTSGLASGFGVVPRMSLASVLVKGNRNEELLQIADEIASFGGWESVFKEVGASFRALGLFGLGKVQEARAELETQPGSGESMAPEWIGGEIRSVGIRRRVLGLEARRRCEELVAEAQRRIDATGLTIFQPDLDLQRAELARDAGDETTWRSLLEGARRIFEADGRSLRVAEIDAELSG